MEELERIISILKTTFHKNAWHGPSVKEALENITEDMALQKPSSAHSIIELVGHMTSWRIFTIKRLNGDNEFKVDENINFPALTSWKIALIDLEDSQEKLIQAVRNFPPSRLSEIVPHGEYRYTYYTLIHGIIHHDLYHTGQIMLLKKYLQNNP